MSIDQAALANNKKLFDLYARKLSSDDVNSFIEIAEKLAFWLNNEKAYYDQARPEIVKLLMVAQSTFRRALSAVVDPAIPFHAWRHIAHPLVPPYLKLIDVVKRFMHLFVEQELQRHIHHLVSAADNSPPHPHPPAIIQSPQNNQQQPSLSNIGPPNPQASSPAIPSTMPIPKPPVVSESPAMIASTAAPQKGVVQKIKKKRKPLDYLIDVDLRKFRELAPTAQTQTTVVEPAKQEFLHDPEADRDKLSLSEPSEAILPPNLSRKSSLSVQANPLASAEEPAQKASIDEVKVFDDHHSQQTGSPIVQYSRNDPDLPANASTTQMTPEGAPCLKGNPMDPIIQLLGTRDPVTSTVLEDGGHLKSAPVDTECGARVVSPQLVNVKHASEIPDGVLSEPIDGVKDHMVGVRDEVKASEDVDMTVAEDNQELVQEKPQNLDNGDIHDEQPTQTTVLEKIEELHTKISLYVPQPPLDHELEISRVNKNRLFFEDYLEKEEIRSLLGLDDEKNGTCTEMDVTYSRPGGLLVEVSKPSQPIMDEDAVMRNLFERIKVPAFVKGLRNPGRVTVNFNIKPAIHLSLKRWTEKSCHSASGINNAMCITLGCYKATEAALSAIANNSEQNWKEFIAANQSSWPQTGGLHLILQHYNIPLSPPIIVTSDGLLDISNLLAAGPNSLELRSHRDMSKYVFALAVHPPTPSQLTRHHEYCKKEQDWQNWITSLAQPFNIDTLAR